MVAVLWFRRDLRLRDLPSLLAAAAEGDAVLACFVVDTKDHAEAIATVKESVGARAASPVLAVIQGDRK